MNLHPSFLSNCTRCGDTGVKCHQLHTDQTKYVCLCCEKYIHCVGM